METIKDNFFSRKGYSNVLLTIILMVTLLTGLVSITLRSPMVGLDEMGHYARSIELSNGNLLSLQDGNPALAGGKISNRVILLSIKRRIKIGIINFLQFLLLIRKGFM